VSPERIRPSSGKKSRQIRSVTRTGAANAGDAAGRKRRREYPTKRSAGSPSGSRRSSGIAISPAEQAGRPGPPSRTRGALTQARGSSCPSLLIREPGFRLPLSANVGINTTTSENSDAQTRRILAGSGWVGFSSALLPATLPHIFFRSLPLLTTPSAARTTARWRHTRTGRPAEKMSRGGAIGASRWRPCSSFLSRGDCHPLGGPQEET